MRQRLVYMVFRGFAAFFSALPAGAMRRTGETLGYLASFFTPSRLRVAERHMRRVLGPDADARREARRLFASYGRYWAEVFWVRPHRIPRMFASMDVSGWDNLWAAHRKGRGIVFVLPHLGNWEIAGARARAEGVGALAVAEALPNRLIRDWFIAVRNQMGIDVVLAEEGSAVTKALIERLRAGGNVALVADRDISGRGVRVEFFGEETTMPAGPLALADRTGAAIVPMSTYFTDDGGYHMIVHPEIVVPAAEHREERVARGTQALAAAFERIIRGAPTQWHLLQPNWPSDEAEA